MVWALHAALLDPVWDLCKTFSLRSFRCLRQLLSRTVARFVGGPKLPSLSHCGTGAPSGGFSAVCETTGGKTARVVSGSGQSGMGDVF